MPGPSARRPCRRAAAELPAAVLAAVLASGPAAAYSSYGLGALDCTTYLARRADDQQAGTMQNTAYIHSFLSGYLTAGNMMHGLIGDHDKDISIKVHTVVQWLDARCLEHRDERIAAALEHFWVEAMEAKDKLKRLDSP